MQEFYHKWYSQYLNRDFEMLVFGHAGHPVILFPTAKGRYYENKDCGLIESVSKIIDEGKVRIYCPDGIDSESWFNYEIHPADRVKTHMAYERVIINDVIGFAKYESETEKVTLAGCGFGGYHAANIAFRHPQLVTHLFTMGAQFNIKPHIMGHYDDDCYFNNPEDYISNLEDEWFLSRIKLIRIILGVGEWDALLGENENFSSILKTKNIEHNLDIRKWAGSDWRWWKEMFVNYLGTIS